MLWSTTRYNPVARFAKVKKYAGVDLPLPERKTAGSAGYDMAVAEDIIIPPYQQHMATLSSELDDLHRAYSIDELSTYTKFTGAKPTLVPTGMKCYLDEGTYLGLTIRSSSPLKYWLTLANAEGIIDADYADNSDNEGHIYFQVINFSPVPIVLHKGDIIGQAIIHSYHTTDYDVATGTRTGGFGSTTR